MNGAKKAFSAPFMRIGEGMIHVVREALPPDMPARNAPPF
jgi:hypothetical protein